MQICFGAFFRVICNISIYKKKQSFSAQCFCLEICWEERRELQIKRCCSKKIAFQVSRITLTHTYYPDGQVCIKFDLEKRKSFTLWFLVLFLFCNLWRDIEFLFSHFWPINGFNKMHCPNSYSEHMVNICFYPPFLARPQY